MGNLFFLKRINTSTMTGKADEEEYQMYEEVFREKISGEALLFVYYLDHESFEKVEEINIRKIRIWKRRKQFI